MTAEAASQRSIHGLHVRHDRINALGMPGVLEVEVGLCPLESDQKLFAEDLDPVKPEKTVHILCGLVDGHGNVGSTQQKDQGKDD
jgi:hypothetical protein